jgi:hypothetical protein
VRLREILGAGKVRLELSRTARPAPRPATTFPAPFPPRVCSNNNSRFTAYIHLNPSNMSKDVEEKRLKKEKKEKKEKRAETDGVKKSKKDKKPKADVEMVDALEAELEKAPEDSIVNVVDGDEPRGALVPFAFPLADESKEVKKILKTVKKCTPPFPKAPHSRRES